MLCDTFPDALKVELDKGLSFPAARQAALERMGIDGSALALPNNILAIEYCKAILAQKSPLKPHVIFREGGYHDKTPNNENPSATALREMLEHDSNWLSYVPAAAATCFQNASIHNLMYGERAILTKLRTMSDNEFKALPYGSEGLWRKLMHASREEATLDDIITATKSKRYTRTRIDRMIMCAFLGITEQDLTSPAPYVRVLAFNDLGRQILKSARANGNFVNIGEKQNSPFQLLEDRCGDLYGLFASQPQKPGIESNYRIYYHK